MATIRTAIQINDMMSQQFRAMNMAMTTVISSFEKLQDASGEAIDVSALNAAQRELQQIEAQYSKIEHQIKEADRAQQKFNRSIDKGEMETWGMYTAVGALAGAYVSFMGAGQLIKTSDDLASTKARLDLMNDGLQTTEELQRMIMGAALRSDAAYSTMSSNVAKLGQNAKDAFSSTEQVVLFSELLNKQFTIAGATVTEIESATLQLTQALGSGVLRGEELNAVFEAAPNIIQTIADHLDVNIGKIREMASNGEITADIITAAILGSADEINKKYNSMSKTFARLWSNFKNYAIIAFEPVLIRMNEIANNATFQAAMMSAVNAMGVFARFLLWVLDISAALFSFLYNNWDFLGPVIIGVSFAVGALIAMLILAKLATLALAGAQMLLAATNPFMWIVVGVILLIAILYLAVAAINHLTGSSISATGIIAGLFMFLAAVIYNQVANIWNVISAFWEFFTNVAQHPMYSVKRLFYNLASSFLNQTIAMTSGWDGFATGMANAFVDAINVAIRAWNAFVGLLPDTIASSIGLTTAGEISHRTSITSDLKGLRGALDDWVGEPPSDYWVAPKMDFKSYGGAWETGYDWGANLFKFDLDKMKLAPSTNGYSSDILDAINAGNMANDDTAGNTKKLADSVDMATEDLAYLRDIAEREAINRYTTGNIKIEMKNDNHINNEMDIDGIIDRFAEKLEEAVDVVAEGGVTDV